MKNHNFVFGWTSLSVGLFSLVLFSGCGGQKLPPDMPKLHPTVITIEQEGVPLASALVTMVNVDQSIAWSCVARTDASGRATMQTNGMYNGVPEGTYTVTVTKQEVEGSDPYADAPDPNTDREAYQAWYSQNASRIAAMESQPPVVYNLVNPEFSSRSTSTLEVTITAGRNQQTLDVGKAIREVSRETSRRE